MGLTGLSVICPRPKYTLSNIDCFGVMCAMAFLTLLSWNKIKEKLSDYVDLHDYEEIEIEL